MFQKVPNLAITHIYNQIRTCDTFPAIWKIAGVIPIFKSNPNSLYMTQTYFPNLSYFQDLGKDNK